ncbi:hypothetical protein NM688_g4971 [Phlebia brevispora]|uniref:Uncharacterized protein n=1 Tax=Phlebia brevispora TaxID=194682 RepID=A0ACC1T204_9APHY|nr:hypothetical protein NM688_g4971 [Phlebia brevispora]
MSPLAPHSTLYEPTPHLDPVLLQSVKGLDALSERDLRSIEFDLRDKTECPRKPQRLVCVIPCMDPPIRREGPSFEWPLHLHVVGQIITDPRTMLRIGNMNTGGILPRTTTGFWIEARRELMSKIQWQQMRLNLEKLKANFPLVDELDMSAFCGVNEGTNDLRIFVHYDKKKQRQFPVYDADGDRIVFKDVSQVPVGIAVRAIFQLQCAKKPGTAAKYMLHAPITYLAMDLNWNMCINLVLVALETIFSLNCNAAQACRSLPLPISPLFTDKLSLVIEELASMEPPDAQQKFKEDWNANVKLRVQSWKENRPHQSKNEAQLTWVAHVVEYVTYLYKNTRVHRNSKCNTPKPLSNRIPLHGPYIIPPSYGDYIKRSAKLTEFTPDSYQNVRDASQPMFAGTVGYLQVTAKSMGFIGMSSPWAISFAATRARPRTAGTNRSASQRHLWSFGKDMRNGTYRPRLAGTLVPARLIPFSASDDKTGYDDHSITHDLISDVYAEFSTRTRQNESHAYLKTLSAIVLSLDATFKAAKKATIVPKQKDGAHQNPMKGGVLSMINELNEIIAWRFCQTQSTSEIAEMLRGYAARCDILEVAAAVMAVADNCCSVRSAIQPIFPSTAVVPDVFHFKSRYAAVVLNGVKNLLYKMVLRDIVEAILKQRAEKGKPAEYWDTKEQEKHLLAAFKKWEKEGTVWSAAALKVHAEQLRHVRKGCLTCVRQDLPSDGSRIEGSHKGWNSIMRTYASGLENMLYLCCDFVLRRNIHIATRSDANRSLRPFAASTYRSHHISYVDFVNRFWNSLISKGRGIPKKSAVAYVHAPVLIDVDSKEMFGIVNSESAASFGGLFDIKEEEDDSLDLLRLHEDLTEDELLDLMQIDARLRHQPLMVSSSTSTVPNAAHVGTGAAHIQAAVNTELTTTAEPTIVNVDTNISPPIIVNVDTTTSPPIIVNVDTTTLPPITPIDVDAIASSAVEKEIIPVVAASPPLEVGTACAVRLRSSEDVVVTGAAQTQLDSGISAQSGSLAQEEEATDEESGAAEATAVAATTCPDASKKRKIGETEAADEDSKSGGEASARKRIRVEGGTRTVTAHGSSLTQSSVNKNVGLEKFFTKHQREAKLAECHLASNTPASIPSFAPASTPFTFKRSRDIRDLMIKLPQMQGSNLTPSQALFSSLTELDIRCLRIQQGNEFFMFMDLRARFQWASFKMNAFKWVSAAEEYNKALTAYNQQHGLPTVKKNPRALVEALISVEQQILNRIFRKDFKSRSFGAQDSQFWWKHCFAVPLGKDMQDAEGSGQKFRKPPKCTRCKSLMYPNGKNGAGNHKCGVCSDGSPVNLKNDTTPPWPQLVGIFNGETNEFFAVAFLQAVQELYQHTIIDGVARNDLSMEMEAFASMLMSRMEYDKPEAGMVVFRLFEGFAVSSPIAIDPCIVELADKRYLRLDCLVQSND